MFFLNTAQYWMTKFQVIKKLLSAQNGKLFDFLDSQAFQLKRSSEPDKTLQLQDILQDIILHCDSIIILTRTEYTHYTFIGFNPYTILD